VTPPCARRLAKAASQRVHTPSTPPHWPARATAPQARCSAVRSLTDETSPRLSTHFPPREASLFPAQLVGIGGSESVAFDQ